MAFGRMIAVIGIGVGLAAVASSYGQRLLAEPESEPAPETPPEAITGTARVIDGDSLEIGGQVIALFGIDAPEKAQTCRFYGEREACGEDATEHLFQQVTGTSVTCRPTGGRRGDELLARCEAGGADLARVMVADGWALALEEQTDAYVADEVKALDDHRGLWAGEFLPPAQWRKEHAAE